MNSHEAPQPDRREIRLSEVSITQLDPTHDMPEVIDLEKRAYQHPIGDIAPADMARGIEALDKQSDAFTRSIVEGQAAGEQYLLARDGEGRLLGEVDLGPVGPTASELYELHIDPTVQGNRLAHKLLKEALGGLYSPEQLWDKNYVTRAKVIEGNPEADFYMTLQYLPTGEREVGELYPGGPEITRMVYEAPVGAVWASLVGELGD